MNFNIKIIKSKRKTLSIEIKSDSSIIARAPIKMSDRDIMKFVKEKTPWIEKHLGKIQTAKPKNIQKLTEEQVKSLIAMAKIKIPKRCSEISSLMGQDYNKVTIKKLYSRWGSCSIKKNLNFNFLLMLCPDEVVDYVIIHELSHLVHMNHSGKFWAYVERFCPDYKKCKKWLKENGNSLIERIK